MALADQRWTRVFAHEMVLEWCRSERDTRLVKEVPPHEMPAVDELLRSGDLADPSANTKRLEWLWRIRGGLLQRIPRDTEWHDVRQLTDAELDELRVIYRCAWDDLRSHRNELLQVATLKKEPLTTPPDDWQRPILWGHSSAGPFTIIEGNHRLIGYASQSPPPGLRAPVLVGLSPSPCVAWHILDALRFGTI
jgi:hypothetical protein